MPVFRLTDELLFPPPELANEDGILAIGGDLSPQRLVLAYSMGLFPWFNPGEPILWWSPDPRFVLFPKKLKVSKSMRPYFNQKKFRVTYNTCFETIMRNCQQQYRKRQAGTWITDEMIVSYTKLNESGIAHSVEVWQGDELVGGLYGIALGKIFFGESMFAKVSNASKFGFITLVRKLEA
ncbi:MAG TPA: leucyl/phenylalanyl-tRNA--protein transferase, partial [Phaeodactylibacter sp.]|nr:leucyl/phenylalanyl-tRNA--protein transferase [Phaeodactylibacter sp.]